MGLSHSPSIVTDGLVLCLDAGNTKSYPGSGTAWRDLSGRGNTGTLTNGPTFDSANGGYFSFNGTTNYVSLPSSSDFNFGTNNFTIDCWVLITTSKTHNVYSARSASTNGISFRISALNKLEFFYDNIGSGGTTGATTIATNAWKHICLTREGSNFKLWLNGVLDATSVTITASMTSSNNPWIGHSRTNLNEYFGGYISNLRVLKDKALTAQEIQQNFNALRGRYGI